RALLERQQAVQAIEALLKPRIGCTAREIQVAQNVLDRRLIVRRRGRLNASVNSSHWASNTRCLSGGASSAGLFLGYSSLRGGQGCNGHAVRRATDIIQADLVTEHHARGVAAVLSANSDLQLLTGLASPAHADFHQSANSVLVNRLKRVISDDVVLAVVAD